MSETTEGVGRVLIRNEVHKPCRSCGEVHEFLSSDAEGDCATPIAVDPDSRYFDTLRQYGEAVPAPDGAHAIDWPEPT